MQNDKQQLAAMGEHLADQQPLCMAKRIEELETQVRVMAELLREAQRYVQYRLDYTECDARIVMGLIYDIKSALAGKLPVPVVLEGWQLVPVEPTEEILRAIRSCVLVDSCYHAMLAAAPKPDSTK